MIVWGGFGCYHGPPFRDCLPLFFAILPHSPCGQSRLKQLWKCMWGEGEGATLSMKQHGCAYIYI